MPMASSLMSVSGHLPVRMMAMTSLIISGPFLREMGGTNLELGHPGDGVHRLLRQEVGRELPAPMERHEERGGLLSLLAPPGQDRFAPPRGEAHLAGGL